MKAFSRRDFMKVASLVTGATVLAACQQAPEPTQEMKQEPETTSEPPKPVGGDVTIMIERTELTEEQEAQFEAKYPGITITFIQNDGDRRTAMLAAGTAPDIIRTVAADVPGWLLRNLMLDLTPYFQTSEVLKIDDLAPANYYYFAEDSLHIGTGKIYGMVKDWSPLMTLFINTAIFEEAGVPVPNETTVLTYAEIFDMARKFTKKEGDRTLHWGFGGGWNDWFIDHAVIQHIAETKPNQGANPYVGLLYNDIFNKINLTANDPAKECFKYYFELAKEGLASSPIDPTSSWNGEDFIEGKLAIALEGYWFQAMAETDATRGKVKMLPSPRWNASGKRYNYPSATGAVIYSGTKVPDAAWKVFEWYMGEEPAVDRAKGGWGVPGLISLYPQMPQDTELSQNCYRVLQEEFKNADCQSPMPNCPWGSIWFQPIWNRHTEPALTGNITLEEAFKNIEEEVNTTLGEHFKKYS